MSVLGDVFGSLRAMTQLQLLLAFIACIGYAFAQGNLLPRRGRRVAWGAAAFAATAFAFESSDWTLAVMLLGFAIAGMGSFVALVWLTSRALGFGRTRTVDAAGNENEVASGIAVSAPGASRAPRSGDHAHSL